MSHNKLFAKNLLFTFSSRGVEIIAGLAVVALLTRFLDLETYGSYSVMMAVMWVVLPIFNLGYPRILVREISQQQTRTAHFMMIGLTWNLFVTLVLFTALFLFSFRLSGYELLLYALIIGNVAIMAVTQTVGSVYVAFQRMHYETGPTLLTMLLLVLLMTGVVFSDLGMLAIFTAYGLAYLAGLAVSILLTGKLFPWLRQLALNLKGVQSTFRESLYIGIFQLLVQLYLYSGNFMLKWLVEYDDVALFQAPFRIFTRLQIVPMSFMPVLLPIFSRLLADSGSRKDFTRTSRSIFMLMGGIGLLLTVCCFFLADFFIPLLLGENFTRSSAVFKVLSLSICFFFLNTVFDTLFIASRKIQYLTLIQLSGLLVCAAVNLILVPEMSYIGSSWAIFISSGTMLLANIYFWYSSYQRL